MVKHVRVPAVFDVYQLYGLTEEAPSFARLSTYEKKEMSEEIRIVEGKGYRKLP